MSPKPASAVSESSKARAGQSNKPSLRALAENLILRARLWLLALVSRPYARVVMIFVAGFVVGVGWDAYGSGARKAIAGWSPHLGWLAPATSSERIKSMELALATARQSLNKLANEMGRLEVQGVDAPRRRFSN